MKTKKAQRFLQQIERHKCLIENKRVELEEWRSISLSVTARMDGERVQSSGSQQKMADAADRFMDLEREIVDEIYKLAEAKSAVLNVIERLNTKEYDVLHKRYVQGLSFAEIAIAKERTYSWVTSVHGRALVSVQNYLEEKETNEST